MSQIAPDDARFAQLAEFIDAQPDKAANLIAILHYAQGLFDYLPNEVQLFVARHAGVPAAKVYGVISFYSFFTTKRRGKYKINVCLGTACFVKGIEKVYNEFKNQLNVVDEEVTEDGLFSVHPVRCIGCCGLAPVIMINDEVHPYIGPSDVSKIIASYRKKEGE